MVTTSKAQDITQQYLKEAFDFDPASGSLIWSKTRPLGHFKGSREKKVFMARFAGKVAGTSHITRGRKSAVLIRVLNKTRYAHHLVWVRENGSIPLEMEVDHANRNGCDNRPCNLRLVHGWQNAMNRGPRRDNKSRLKGVVLSRGKWVSEIAFRGKRLYLGDFPTKGLAAVAYAKASIRYHGEFSFFARRDH